MDTATIRRYIRILRDEEAHLVRLWNHRAGNWQVVHKRTVAVGQLIDLGTAIVDGEYGNTDRPGFDIEHASRCFEDALAELSKMGDPEEV